jgi:hypothetical protein
MRPFHSDRHLFLCQRGESKGKAPANTRLVSMSWFQHQNAIRAQCPECVRTLSFILFNLREKSRPSGPGRRTVIATAGISLYDAQH